MTNKRVHVTSSLWAENSEIMFERRGDVRYFYKSGQEALLANTIITKLARWDFMRITTHKTRVLKKWSYVFHSVQRKHLLKCWSCGNISLFIWKILKIELVLVLVFFFSSQLWEKQYLSPHRRVVTGEETTVTILKHFLWRKWIKCRRESDLHGSALLPSWKIKYDKNITWLFYIFMWSFSRKKCVCVMKKQKTMTSSRETITLFS